MEICERSVVCWYNSPPPPANRTRHSAPPSAEGVHVGLTHTLGVEEVGYCPCSGSCKQKWYCTIIHCPNRTANRSVDVYCNSIFCSTLGPRTTMCEPPFY